MDCTDPKNDRGGTRDKPCRGYGLGLFSSSLSCSSLDWNSWYRLANDLIRASLEVENSWRIGVNSNHRDVELDNHIAMLSSWRLETTVFKDVEAQNGYASYVSPAEISKLAGLVARGCVLITKANERLEAIGLHAALLTGVPDEKPKSPLPWIVGLTIAGVVAFFVFRAVGQRAGRRVGLQGGSNG